MTNKNDERIMTLKKQIQEKKDKLGAISRFSPATNMSLELDGTRFNLNVTNKEQLMFLAVRINAYKLSAEELRLNTVFKISGYFPCDWLADIKARIAILDKKEEEKTLAAMESKLSTLLSEEKRVELELEELMAQLGGSLV